MNTDKTLSELNDKINQLAIDRAQKRFKEMLDKVQVTIKPYMHTDQHCSVHQGVLVKQALAEMFASGASDSYKLEQIVTKDEYIVKQVNANRTAILDEILNKLPLVKELSFLLAQEQSN